MICLIFIQLYKRTSAFFLSHMEPRISFARMYDLMTVQWKGGLQVTILYQSYAKFTMRPSVPPVCNFYQGATYLSTYVLDSPDCIARLSMFMLRPYTYQNIPRYNTIQYIWHLIYFLPSRECQGLSHLLLSCNRSRTDGRDWCRLTKTYL